MKEPKFKVGQEVAWKADITERYLVEDIRPSYNLRAHGGTHLHGISEESLVAAPEPDLLEPTKAPTALSPGDSVLWRKDFDEVYVVLNGPGYSIRGKQSGKVRYNVCATDLSTMHVDTPEPTKAMFLYAIGDLVRYQDCLFRITRRRCIEEEGCALVTQYTIGVSCNAQWHNESDLAPR